MRQRTRRRQLEPSRQGRAAASHGPFGPVKIHARTAEQLAHADISRPTADRSMSMTAFFEYLHDHQATTDLAKALADMAMLRTSGARANRVPSIHERIAS